MISGGVLSSCPSQKGQRPTPTWVCASPLKSCGRFARSCAMITQRPTIGSFLNSGIVPASTRMGVSKSPSLSDLPHDPLEIGRRNGQLEDPLARGPVEAGVAAEQLDVETDRLARLETEPPERCGQLEDLAGGDLDGVSI